MPTSHNPNPPPKLGVLGAYGQASDDKDAWTRVRTAIDHLEFSVRQGLGSAAVRRALDDTAEDLALYVDRADPDDLDERKRAWRKLARMVVGPGGEDIDEAALVALRGDAARVLTQQAANRKATGVTFAREGDGGYRLVDRDGTTLMTLPELAGRHVIENPQKFGAQIELLRTGLKADDEGGLQALATNVFANVHERDHEALERRLLYKPTDARTQAALTGFDAIRRAKTPEERKHAEAVLRTALFAEAAPGKRLAYLGLDIFTPVGNVNAFNDFQKETSDAYKAFAEGRHLDGAWSSMWAAVDLVGAASGIRVGKLMKEAAKHAPGGRKLVAAADLARMERNGRKKHRGFAPEAIVGPKLWAKLDDDQRGFLTSISMYAKGRVGENAVAKNLDAVGAPSFALKEARDRAAGKKPTPPRKKPTNVYLHADHGGKLRKFDDALVDATMKRVLGIFLMPKRKQGTKTLIETKAYGAQKSPEQRVKDEAIKDHQKKYGKSEQLLLQVPYAEASKSELRDLLIQRLIAPGSRGQQYVTTGVQKIVKKGEKGEPDITRLVKWEPSEIEAMARAVDRNLTRLDWSDRAPTVGDFLIGIGARMAAKAENDQDQTPPDPPKLLLQQATSPKSPTPLVGF